MGRGAVALGALLIVAGGAGLGYAFTRKAHGGWSPKAREAMGTAMSQLDSEITRARSKLRGAADALAKLVPVQAVVVTDPVTARDSAEKGELRFSPDPGEVIEIGQVVGGAATTFLVQPEGGVVMARNGVPGSYADLDGGRLAIAEIAAVSPTQDNVKDGQPITGYVSVNRVLDIAPLITMLEQAGVTGRLENAAPSGVQSRTIGTPTAGAKTEVRPLPSQQSLHLVVELPTATKAAVPKNIVGGSVGVAVLGLIVLVIGLVTKPKLQPIATAATQPSLQSIDGAPSGPNQPRFSGQQSVASGTPSPIDSTALMPVSPVDLGPGAMIGRWEVIRRLGSGGMADVYLAQSKGEAGFEKLVAIKVMHPHLARNTRAVDHFLDEAKLAARISHPNVVAIQDLGKIGNDYVIVMDYVEGVDLERLLASARAAGRVVPIAVGLGILCRVCDGLHAAHTAVQPDGTPLGIIHRDVKSANVLVSRQGGVKVVDFGIAKAATQSHMTVAGETKGTPSMMAPEQRVGELVDVRADVYSVGAVAFEVLTGHAVNLDLAALAHLGVENWPHLPPPSSLRHGLPPELDGVLLTAMSFDRERRPPNCAAFETIFEGVMKTHGITCSDKDIARWVETELSQLVPPFQGASAPISKPTTA